jgi:hypothetical protein
MKSHIVQAHYITEKFRPRRAGDHGIGLFATEALSYGHLLEVAPASRFDGKSAPAARKTPMWGHTFVDPAQYGEPDADLLMVWGKMTLCNHSEDPNAAVIWMQHGEVLHAGLITIREIKRGEEITIRYTNWEEYGIDAA